MRIFDRRKMRQINKLRLLPLLLIALLAAGSGVIMSKGKESPEQGRRKLAKYYYYNGTGLINNNKSAEGYEMMRRAYEIDTTFSPAAMEYGMWRLMIGLDSVFKGGPEMLRSMSITRKFTDEYPADERVLTYAMLLNQMDTIEESRRLVMAYDSASPDDSNTPYMALIHFYGSDGQYDKAMSVLDRMEARDGEGPETYIVRLNLLYSQGDTASLISTVKSYAAKHPGEADYVLLEGNIYDVLSMPDSALNTYERAEKLAPTSPNVKMALADAYRTLGDSVAYDNKIYEFLLLDDTPMENKVEVLATYLQTLLDDKANSDRGDYLFSVLSRQYPHEPEVLDLAARYNAAKGNLTEAIERMSYAISQNPTDGDYRLMHMRYLMADQQYDNVMKAYTDAEKHISPDINMKMLYAGAATMKKDYNNALDIYRRLISELDSTYNFTDTISRESLMKFTYDGLGVVSEYYQSAGDVFYAIHDLPSAYLCYENSLAANPENALTLNNYAYFLSENDGDLDKAAKMSKAANDAMPDNPTFLDTYAWILFRKGEYKEARTWMESAIENAEKEAGERVSSDILSHYGDILFMCGEPKKALENWKRALENSDADTDEKLLQTLRKKIEHKTFFYE